MSDAVAPVDRAPVLRVYRFWRDMGYAVGAIISGTVADAAGYRGAIPLVARLTRVSGMFGAARHAGRAPGAAAVARNVSSGSTATTSLTAPMVREVQSVAGPDLNHAPFQSRHQLAAVLGGAVCARPGRPT